MYVNFYDTLSNHKDTLWFPEINPFNDLPFEKTGYSVNGFTNYSLSRSDLIKLIPESNRSIYNIARQRLRSGTNQYSGRSSSSICYDSDTIVAIAFTLVISDPGYIPYGVLGAIKVYNRFGHLLLDLKNLNVNINQLAISGDSKYVCYNYGYPDESGFLLEDGFRVYNIKTGQLVLDVKGHHMGIPYISGNLITNFSINSNIHTSYVFDTEKSILYTKDFTYKEVCDLKDIDNTGFHFINSNGDSLFVAFEHFKHEQIK